MGRSVRIYSGVELDDAGFIEIGSGVIFRRGVNFQIEQPRKVKIGSRVSFKQDVHIICRDKGSKLTLDDNVCLDRGVDLKVAQGGQIEIGRGTYIGPYTCISCYGQLKIGQFVTTIFVNDYNAIVTLEISNIVAPLIPIQSAHYRIVPNVKSTHGRHPLLT